MRNQGSEVFPTGESLGIDHDSVQHPVRLNVRIDFPSNSFKVRSLERSLRSDNQDPISSEKFVVDHGEDTPARPMKKPATIGRRRLLSGSTLRVSFLTLP